MPMDPTLDLNHRLTIGTNFMKTLCEKSDQAESEGKEVGSQSLNCGNIFIALGFGLVWPLPVHYFCKIGFIKVNDEGNVAITRERKAHCNDTDDSFTLPEYYQAPETNVNSKP